MSIDAMKQALEALDYYIGLNRQETAEAITNLRAAIAQAEEAEPVEHNFKSPQQRDYEMMEALKARPSTVCTVPEGWKLVPLEPTAEMIVAGTPHTEGDYSLPHSLYTAMLAAAPEVPK